MKYLKLNSFDTVDWITSPCIHVSYLLVFLVTKSYVFTRYSIVILKKG